MTFHFMEKNVSAGLNSMQGQFDLSFQCRIGYTALANCPCYNTEINQYPHQLAYCVPAT